MQNHPPVVMVVDDDPLILAACKSHLEEAGYSVLVAEDGEPALRLLRTQKVDAVFLDILMPRMDGIETLLEIKKLKLSLRVYTMSGGGRAKVDQFLDVGMKFGADGRLKKPFSPADMIRLLGSSQNDVLRAGEESRNPKAIRFWPSREAVLKR
jgi:DNA-binding response OmpR family regulator